MKRILVMMTAILSFSLISFSLFAQTVKTTINQIHEPTTDDPDYLIFANDGHVYGISAQDEDLARIAREALASSSVIELELKERTDFEKERDMRSTVENVTILREANALEVPLRPNEFGSDSFVMPEAYAGPLSGYSLTWLSQGEVGNLFRSMRNDLSGASECYNRAHVWSWEIYQNRRYNTGKMFLFFTRRYINEYRYKWWFHVAPFINVRGEPQHVVLDRQYAGGPRVMHSWTDMFMRNDAHCPVVDRYSSYSQNQYARYCYLIPASMYYWQPYNLDNLERRGISKRVYIQREVNHAYRDARRSW